MKHYTLDERIQIQRALTLNQKFTQIAKSLGKDRTSVSREIRSHLKGEGKPARSKCLHRHKCIFDDPTDCPAPTCSKRACSIACSQCARYCDKYEPEICPKLLKPPYVCNGCDERGINCLLDKRLYDAEYAHSQYKRTLSESRTGISLTENELQHISDTVIPLIKKGVSLSVAYREYADSMPVSERTLYEYIDKGVFNACNLDLRRKVRRKPLRKKSGPELRVDKQYHIGRTYADFIAFTGEHPDLQIREMDTVEGKKGGKVILTIFFRECDLQQTNQKSRCERSHEYIRYILPKGSSFDNLSQEDVTLVMNHVNSMPRASLNGKAPVQVFLSLYGEETAAKLGLHYIPLEELLLLPELLKK